MPRAFTFLVLCISLAVSSQTASAQATTLPSHCLAMATAPRHPVLQRVATGNEKLDLSEVRITFVGHSTFRIESAEGVQIATDYAGFAGEGPIPDAVTMNQAHSTHYTESPDPAIKHVLRGWNPDGGAANHNLRIRDIRIRNVPTDIRSWSGEAIKDGNSIFIFEVAGLCIGHLGHLHHKLEPGDIGLIGRLDIVFVPVDGSFTMDQASMTEVIKALKARLIIPMHYFGPTTLNAFLLKAKDDFDVELNPDPVIVVSSRTLPDIPKVLVLPGF
ncbi:MAG: MBL fold metallo-hydrolase [Hyphomicrobiaceae bacterium]